MLQKKQALKEVGREEVAAKQPEEIISMGIDREVLIAIIRTVPSAGFGEVIDD